ncbi:alpha/beta hydrolase [Paraburkholderia madseniana]|uniref:Alpha/beta hydrolase n=1 Tax=Paraburkholderia madseniana TaxID=2599607 RepID=A0AAP5B7Z3_9BURK|nr:MULTISPECIES: alpha/beta hydrolase [Paraburkholderia]MCX4144561.1 alpha/beta hydrolase [Paraburkholderia madseniana]MDN7147513.1 alpha/beta hydrolase [Paraburkholderia sp. WS6]MDQ6406393.1 alpha/beta hydrolase [Paraburkholderia madseniana]
MAEVSPEEARAGMAARTAAREPGPHIDKVVDFIVPGLDAGIPVRIYHPKDATGVTMAFHGGGWLMGNRDSFDAVCRHLANDSGLAVVSVDYRLAPEHPFPAALDDVWAATCWVAEYGHKLGLPSERLTVFGESAGGNLAAVVCLLAREHAKPRILAQALVYPATDARQQGTSLSTYAEGFVQRKVDVEHAFRTYALDHGVTPTTWKLSPFLADDHAGLPPAIVITAECDGLRDDGEAYARKLAEAGVPTTCVRYLGMLHTFYSMRGQVDAATLAQRQIADALRHAVQAA